jgi:intraflagellar transport protein 80
MWRELFKWEKALELAMKNGEYVDIVLYLRSEYLKATGMKEANPKFIECARKVYFNQKEVLIV